MQCQHEVKALCSNGACESHADANNNALDFAEAVAYIGPAPDA
jgi:hypothetical protein